MKLKKAYWISQIVMFAGIILSIAASFTPAKWLVAGGIMTALLGVLLGAVFYRCPYCKKALQVRNVRADHCPYCGRPLK